MNTKKAANLRRVLGIILFATLVGLGISIENMYGLDSVIGLFGVALIFFGGLALAAWGVVGGSSWEDPANPKR